MCSWYRYHVCKLLFVVGDMNITRLVKQVSFVFTQRDRKGGIRGKMGNAAPSASVNPLPVQFKSLLPGQEGCVFFSGHLNTPTCHYVKAGRRHFNSLRFTTLRPAKG
jgi:hypothetical protein